MPQAARPAGHDAADDGEHLAGALAGRLGDEIRVEGAGRVLLDTTSPHEAREITARMRGRQSGVLRAITTATRSAHPAGEIEIAGGWEPLTGQRAAGMAGLG